MEGKNIRPNSVMSWVLAARPKTLSGAAVPVMIGLSLAYSDIGRSEFNIIPAVLCILFAFIMQIDANFVNDYFDYVRGNDDETRLGPRRACAQGWITPGNMKRAIAVTTFVACGLGLPLIIYGGIGMLVVGFLCVLFCFLYTTSLSYLGLGDILVLVFFGIVPVCMTYYLLVGHVTAEAFIASILCGLVIDTLLLVNNYRDIDNSFIYYCHQWAAILPFVYLALHYATYKKMIRINKGKALNLVLGETARNMFIYGLLVSIGFLL